MSAGKFAGIVVALLVGAFVLVWVFVSLAALVYALGRGDTSAAGTYAVLALAGGAACLLAAWAARRVARTRSERH